MEEKMTKFASYLALAFGLGYLTQRVVSDHKRRVDQIGADVESLGLKVYMLEQTNHIASTPNPIEPLIGKLGDALDALIRDKKTRPAGEAQPAQ